MKNTANKWFSVGLAMVLFSSMAACKLNENTYTVSPISSSSKLIVQDSTISEIKPADDTSPLSDMDAMSIAAEIVAAEKGVTVDELGEEDQADILKKADELKCDAAASPEEGVLSEGRQDEVAPINIYFHDNSPIELNVGDNKEVTGLVRYLPQSTTLKLLSFESEDTSIASVDADGLVTAQRAGTTRIKALTHNGKAAYLVVHVAEAGKEVAVASITAANTAITLDVGSTRGIGASVLPADATNKHLSYQSDDPSVATVDKNGLVRALKAGNTTVTVSAANGKSLTVSIQVKVKTLVLVESIALSPKSLQLEVGASRSMAVQYNPSNVSDKSVAFKSSDTSVATVDYSGTVRAVGEGSAAITATASGKTDTVQVTVTRPAVDVKLTVKGNAVVEVGKTVDLSTLVTTTPASEKGNVKFVSQNSSVAAVNGKKLTGVAAGSTIVEANLGNCYGYIKVTVTAPVQVTPNPSDGYRPDIANEIFALVNQERQAAGLSTLEYASGGQADADRRAKEISTDFSHSGNHWGDAENIAYGQKSASAAMTAWMNSPGHRAAIMGRNKSSMAVSVYSSNGKLYFVQLFSSNAATAPSNFKFIKPDRTTVKVGESFSLSLTYSGGDSTTTIKWESTNDKVRVDSSGTVTALAEGTSKVYAHVYHNGSLFTSYVCSVTIEKGEEAVVPTPTPSPESTPAPTCPVCGSTEHVEHPTEPKPAEPTPEPAPEPEPIPEPEPTPEPEPEVTESQTNAEDANNKYGDIFGVIALG